MSKSVLEIDDADSRTKVSEALGYLHDGFLGFQGLLRSNEDSTERTRAICDGP